MEALKSLGIDISGLIMYLVNFGILIGILTKLLYRPVIETIDKRRETIQKNLNEAQEIKISFETEFAKKQAEFDQKIREMEQAVIAAKRSADERAEVIIEEAERKKIKMIQDARVIIGQMKEDLSSEVQAEVVAKMQRVLTAILKDSVPQEVIAQSVKREWESLER